MKHPVTFHCRRSHQLAHFVIKKKKSYLEVIIGICNLVEIQESLVDTPLELQGSLHSLKPASPLVLGRLLDVVENDAPAALHLELHEFLGMFLFFVSRFLEVLGKARESHVIPVKVVRLRIKKNKTVSLLPLPTTTSALRSIKHPSYHREVGVHGVELHVDLFVDAFLGVLSVVLPHLTDGGHFSSLVVLLVIVG